jgi:hypothetical protein
VPGQPSPARPTFAEAAAGIRLKRISELLTVDGVQIAWRIIHGGPFRRGEPARFEVAGPSPVGWWRSDIDSAAAFPRKWHGYRYLAIGVLTPPDEPLPPGTPYWRLFDRQGGECLEQLVLLVQWAAADGCATFARATYFPAERRVDFGTDTIGRAMTPREAQLAQRAQVLLQARTPRGRPPELPVDALERLLAAGRKLGPYDARGRVSLSWPALMSPEGIDKMRQRALIGRLANLVQTGRF